MYVQQRKSCLNARRHIAVNVCQIGGRILPLRRLYLLCRAVASKKATTVWQAWQRIVEQYSGHDLTIGGDKLPAISGIASKIGTATNSDSIARLWRENLVLDLLWRAPSWSWASLDTPSYTTTGDAESESFMPAVVVAAASVVPAGLNPLGLLSTASLSLSGTTIPAALSSALTKGAWIYTFFMKGTSPIIISHDGILCEAQVETEDGGGEATVRRAQPLSTPQGFTAPVLRTP